MFEFALANFSVQSCCIRRVGVWAYCLSHKCHVAAYMRLQTNDSITAQFDEKDVTCLYGQKRLQDLSLEQLVSFHYILLL